MFTYIFAFFFQNLKFSKKINRKTFQDSWEVSGGVCGKGPQQVDLQVTKVVSIIDDKGDKTEKSILLLLIHSWHGRWNLKSTQDLKLECRIGIDTGTNNTLNIGDKNDTDRVCTCDWYRQSNSFGLYHRYPGGESYEDIVARLEPVIMELER